MVRVVFHTAYLQRNSSGDGHDPFVHNVPLTYFLACSEISSNKGPMPIRTLKVTCL
jgi:hypothetical protein